MEGSGRVYQRILTQIRRVLEVLPEEMAFKPRSELVGKSEGKNVGALRRKGAW